MISDDHFPLSEIISLFPGHIYWKDLNGVYLGCNVEQATSLGLSSPAEIVGKTDFDLVWHKEAKELRAVDRQVIVSGIPHVVEEPLVLATGKKIIVISKKVPFRRANGEIVGIIGTSIDITDQKQVERALRDAKEKAEVANVAKSEFIANMSHDLRTPLAGIQALTEDIMSKTRDPDIRKDTDLLLEASTDLLELVDKIMDVVRIDSEKAPKMTRERFDLKKMVSGSIDIVKPSMFNKRIQFDLLYDVPVPDYFEGQVLFLQRVLLNLLGNAIKFTPEDGRITLSFSFEKQQDDQGVLSFTLRDTGIGIPKEKQSIIFEKFSRVQSSTQGGYKGAGVGLYMVKRYLDNMDGHIQLDSEEGKGSVFTCRVPLTVLSDGDVLMPLQEAVNRFVSFGSQLHQGEKISVLLVEDSAIAQRSQSHKLQELNCEVDIAASAKEALSFFDKKSYDLMLLDLGLPDMDGWSLAKRMRRATDNHNSVAPIVILTAHALPEDLVQPTDSGVNEVMRKPLMIEDAEQLLSRFIYRK